MFKNREISQYDLQNPKTSQKTTEPWKGAGNKETTLKEISYSQ